MATPNEDLKALGSKLTDAYMESFKCLSEKF
jgi:hypothetical protein